jgi:hypothetical protein
MISPALDEFGSQPSCNVRSFVSAKTLDAKLAAIETVAARKVFLIIIFYPPKSYSAISTSRAWVGASACSMKRMTTLSKT